MSKKCRAFSASQIGRGAPVMTLKEAFYAGWDAALAEPAIKPDLTTEPVAWAMPRSDGLILDVICPEEHAREPGQYTVPLYAHPYDQQALELCEVCGWKTLIPTEGCLNCERQPKAEQKPVCEVANVLGNMVTALCEGVPPAPGDKLYTAHQPKAEQEPGNWTVYNSGAEVASGLSFSEAWEYMTPERLARQWCAVCVLDKSNLPTAPQPKAWYGVSPMFGTVTFDSYQDALDAGFDNPLPLIEAAVWGEKT
jgi:hypothetical protein